MARDPEWQRRMLEIAAINQIDPCRFGYFLDCADSGFDACAAGSRQPGLFINRTWTVGMGPSIKAEYWEAKIESDPSGNDFFRYRVRFFTVPPRGQCDNFTPIRLNIPDQHLHCTNGMDGVGISPDCRFAFIVSGDKDNPRYHYVQFIEPNRGFVFPDTAYPMGSPPPFAGLCHDIPNVARGVFFSPDMSVAAVVGGIDDANPTMWALFYDIDACGKTPPHTANGSLCSGACNIPKGPTITIEMGAKTSMPSKENIATMKVPGEPDVDFNTHVP